MKWLFFLLSFVSGAAMSIQSGINSQLRQGVNNALFASLVSFIVGTIPLLLIVLFQKQPLPSFDTLSNVNSWKYMGGLLGAFIVTASLLSIAQIGATSMFMLVIAGQLLMALLMDHYGWLGVDIQKINPQKIIGVLLLFGGVFLITKK